MGDKEILKAAVVFADRFFMSAEALAAIRPLGGFVWADATDDQDLAKKLEGASNVQVLVSEYIPVTARVFKKVQGLKGVIAYGAGYDHIDLTGAARQGVIVCNCRGENAQAVAEFTFGILLCLMRKIHLADRYIREGGWGRTDPASLPDWVAGAELKGKTLGIIGLGQIGYRVARIARGFGMRNLAYDPFALPPEVNPPAAEKTTWEQLIQEADIITLHVPLTPATEKMINSQTLERMKPGIWLVNTSRGRVIDEPALLEALKKKRIAGAALDVFAREPISGDHPFAKLENVILSPHLGAITQEAGERLSASVARQVREILEGQTPECVIPQPGSVRP